VRRVREHYVLLLVSGELALVLVCAVFAPVVSPYSPTDVSTGQTLAHPSAAHLLGTDQLGRDVLSRVIWGARPTLETALIGTAIAVAIGVPLGLVAGYRGRFSSSVIMRSMDVLLSFPGILLALVIVTILGSGVSTVFVAIGVSFIPIFTRLMYGETLAVRNQTYVDAARVVGCRTPRVLARHVIPNVRGQLIVAASTSVGWAILVSASLNFLGFGVHPPSADWGADLSNGTAWLGPAWWISAGPGIAITLTILAVNYLGDEIAALLDPRGRVAEYRSKLEGTRQVLSEQ
jgi:ABC-type dipeptide/oligopeptide/nickel transport system permease subunit